MKSKNEDIKDFKKGSQRINSLILVLVGLVGVIFLAIIFVLVDPNLSLFKSSESSLLTENKTQSPADDIDRIENGIHVETGFIDAPGMMITIQNCTNCHSSKLVIANRMTEERWIKTIRWMQTTQNLWDLGENEKIIVDYLVTNYPPKKVGRRANLENIEWYELK